MIPKQESVVAPGSVLWKWNVLSRPRGCQEQNIPSWNKGRGDLCPEPGSMHVSEMDAERAGRYHSFYRERGPWAELRDPGEPSVTSE